MNDAAVFTQRFWLLSTVVQRLLVPMRHHDEKEACFSKGARSGTRGNPSLLGGVEGTRLSNQPDV